MTRTIFLVGVFSVPGLLLIDSAVKGSLLLMLASAIVVLLRRDSAATRHLVWLLAIVVMLAVPPLSALLPEWRVLPQGAGLPMSSPVASSSVPNTPTLIFDAVSVPSDLRPFEMD